VSLPGEVGKTLFLDFPACFDTAEDARDHKAVARLLMFLDKQDPEKFPQVGYRAIPCGLSCHGVIPNSGDLSTAAG
jgi:hypothetical protein